MLLHGAFGQVTPHNRRVILGVSYGAAVGHAAEVVRPCCGTAVNWSGT